MTSPIPTQTVPQPLARLAEQAYRLEPVRAAIVDPLDPFSLGGALTAGERGVIEPVLVGDENKIYDTANRCGWNLRGAHIVRAAPGRESVTAALLAADGNVEMIVKGALHSDSVLHAVLAEPRLRSKRLSHVVVTELPGRETPVLLTDGAVNIAPDVNVKAQIAQNAIDLARAIGIPRPRVAVLAAVETVVS